MEPIETFEDENRGLTAKVLYDDLGHENPRKDFDNAWTLIGFYNPRREFGDEVVNLEEEREYERIEETDEGLDLAGFLRDRYDAHLIVPIQVYDHSLVRYYAGEPVTEHWDTGIAGVAIIDKATLDREWDGNETKARECLDAELETFTEWCNGEIYYYVVEDDEGEHLDSCGGFYGLNHAIAEAKSSLEACAESVDKEAEQVRYWAERDVETV